MVRFEISAADSRSVTYSGAKFTPSLSEAAEPSLSPAVVLRRSRGSRSFSVVSFLSGIGSRGAGTSQPSRRPRRKRISKSARLIRDGVAVGSSDPMTAINVAKPSAPPCAGSAQASSSLKSGAISRMRQGCDSWPPFGSLISLAPPRRLGPFQTVGYRDPRQHVLAHRFRSHRLASTQRAETRINREEVVPEGVESLPGEVVGVPSAEVPLSLFDCGQDLSQVPAEAALENLLHASPKVGGGDIVVLAGTGYADLPDQLPVDQPADLDRNIALALLELVRDGVERHRLRLQIQESEDPALELGQDP